MIDLILSLLNLIWSLISNTYILAFIITGVIFFISRMFGIWYGHVGGVMVYSIVSLVFFIIMNWNKIIEDNLLGKIISITIFVFNSIFHFFKIFINKPIILLILVIAIAAGKIKNLT